MADYEAGAAAADDFDALDGFDSLSIGQDEGGPALADDPFTAPEHDRRPSDVPVHPIDAVVALLNGDEFTVKCSNGRYTTGEELQHGAARELGLPQDLAKHFAIWVVSASLQLQMKPHHLPFKVMKKWPQLLEQYSNGDPLGEVPVLYFKKDAFCHQGLEDKITDSVAIRFFFYEMTFNVVYSLYPCTLEEAAYLAGIHLQLERGGKATKYDVSEIEECFVPEHLRPKVRSKTWAKMVLEERKKLRTEDPLELHTLYLEHGRQWSFYGATFFFGQIEAEEEPGRIVFQEVPDETVRIGTNLDGIHVVNDKTNELKLSLAYDMLSFNSYDDEEADDSAFLIEYDFEDQDGPHQMVIWTLQASMVDTLVSRFIEELHNWEEYKSQRRRALGMSIRPQKKARGRTEGGGQKPGALARMNTLLFNKGNAAADKEKHFTLARVRTKKPTPVPDFDSFDVAPVTTRHAISPL